jgi:predicted enzyme related to lactoylglutathione lyase
MKKNPVGWFEIPVTDMERSIRFYNQVFDYDLEETLMGPLKMAWFPWDQEEPGAPGSLVLHEDFYKPSKSHGVLIYFSCEDVADTLKKVKKAGGTILVEKRLIADDVGYMGLFLDSEGNRIALHSRN